MKKSKIQQISIDWNNIDRLPINERRYIWRNNKQIPNPKYTGYYIIDDNGNRKINPNYKKNK